MRFVGDDRQRIASYEAAINERVNTLRMGFANWLNFVMGQSRTWRKSGVDRATTVEINSAGLPQRLKFAEDDCRNGCSSQCRIAATVEIHSGGLPHRLQFIMGDFRNGCNS